MNGLFDQRVLALAAERQEASVVEATRSFGYSVQVCDSLENLIGQLDLGACAALILQSSLSEEFFINFVEHLHRSPSWSQLPVIIALENQDLTREQEEGLTRLAEYCSIRFLPHSSGASCHELIIRAAVVDRLRQYRDRELHDELESARREASEAGRAKVDFLANMSHEIRTPLGAMLGFCELLSEPGVGERDRQAYMDTIRRNGQQLSALITDVLEMARIDSGRLEVQAVDFSIRDFFENILGGQRSSLQRKGLSLKVEIGAQVPRLIHSDPYRLKQAIKNLLDNAVKFTSHGGVTLRVGGAPKGERSFNLHIEAEDTGIGISGSQSERLFQPFSQVDSSSTRPFGGTGLGLVLARRLLTAMGGDVTLAWSVPGGGSCFVLDVAVGSVEMTAQPPMGELSLSTQAQAVRSANLEAAESRLPLKGSRVLVVDDSIDNQLLLSRILQLWGAEVESASDGLEAIEKAMKHNFNIVLMDLQMPRLGGMEATRILRQRGYKAPIVALTARTLKEDRNLCLSAGCTDYLTKPIERKTLVEVLSRLSLPKPKSESTVRPVYSN